MSTIFISGSRQVRRLADPFRQRLDNIIAAGHRVVVSDADGADAAVQAHYRDHGYERLTVFCSGSAPRNNFGPWSVQHVAVPRGVTGFAFHAVNDRDMAVVADYGLMAWDGKSPGTILNALGLVRAGKASVLFEQPVARSVTIRSVEGWHELVAARDPSVQAAIRQRATPQEWRPSPERRLPRDRAARAGMNDAGLCARSLGEPRLSTSLVIGPPDHADP